MPKDLSKILQLLRGYLLIKKGNKKSYQAHGLIAKRKIDFTEIIKQRNKSVKSVMQELVNFVLLFHQS